MELLELQGLQLQRLQDLRNTQADRYKSINSDNEIRKFLNIYP